MQSLKHCSAILRDYINCILGLEIVQEVIKLKNASVSQQFTFFGESNNYMFSQLASIMNTEVSDTDYLEQLPAHNFLKVYVYC